MLLEQGIGLPVEGRPDGATTRTVPVSKFTRELVEGVEGAREALDRQIAECAIGWDLERIAPLERAILRVALYEILYRPDVPGEVAIDEAVENAKLYCSPQAPAFVNGILGELVKKAQHG